MKKTFSLVDPKNNPERVADKIKHEVKKYLKRERKKTLLEGADFWDFDCKIGVDSDSAMDIHEKEIGKNITDMVENNIETFYLEIIAKPGRRTKKAK